MIRVILFFSFLSAFSQKMNRSDLSIIHNDSLYIIGTQTVLVSPLSDPNHLVLRYSLSETSKELRKYQPVSTGKGLYLLDPLGGEVLAFVKDSLKRLDKSFQHRMQIDASVLTHNDTIFKYGGYGFWSMRNYFTYFDPTIREWEVYPPLNTKKFPIGTATNDYVKKGDNIVFFSGKKLNPNDLVEQTSSFQIWTFNFTNRRWNQVGTTTIDFNQFKLSIPFEDKIAYFDQKEIYVVSPFDNNIKVYAQNSLHQKLIEGSRLQPLYHDEVFYCFTYSNNLDEVNLLLRNKDEFFGPVIREEQMYATFSSYWYLSALLLIIPVVFGYKWMKRYRKHKKRIHLTDSGVVFKNIFYGLSDHEIKILNVLVAEGSVNTSKILEIVENPSHNYSHNMRTKNKVIGELQYKLQTILKIQEEVLSVQKSDEDKRIMIYRLDLRYFKR
ncbi:MAG: hypothetical protein MRY51_06145 [Flavobacteriaceae bacterium]|nr:hypothetical protein [Flavobacteriaceae bacterium]MCI5088541.1 hypothetical protein [Flavobacteriaceae bacterium]CAI8204873.1 MAG: Uncharacterised protein [SAR116 cluster bacterium]